VLDRRVVLSEIRQSFAGASFTTSDVADMLEAREYAVRACVSWLVLAGALAVDGTVTRHDHQGRPYATKLYRLTGRDLPTGRIKQDRAARETAIRLERDSRTKASASVWLARSWTATTP
jgi:hypothetical protein